MPAEQTMRRLPLSPRMFHILLALSDGPENGYRTASRVEENSGGQVRLSPATLYENLHRLARWGLIHEVEGDDDGRGQRFYELTAVGDDALALELERMRNAVRLADSGARTRG